MKLSNRAFAALAVTPLLLAEQAAHAVYTVPTEITAAAADIATLGAAVFGVMVAIKLTKWLRRAL